MFRQLLLAANPGSPVGGGPLPEPPPVIPPGFTVPSYASTVDAALSTDAPTLTVSSALTWATSSSPITSAARHTWDDTAAMRTLGLYPTIASAGSSGTTKATQALSTTPNKPAFAIEFDHHGDDLAVILIRALGTGPGANDPRAQIFIDGHPVTTNPVTLADVALYNQPYAWRMTWGSTATRRIRVDMWNVSIWAVDVEPGATITATPKRAPSLLIYGDSYIEGYNPDGDIRLQSLGWMLGRILDCETYVDGYGGTGYYAGTTATPPRNYGVDDRLDQIEAIAPDAIIIFGTQNDDGVGVVRATVTANATAIFDRLAASLPDTPILVVGPSSYSTTTNTSSPTLSNDAAVEAAGDAHDQVVGYVSPRQEAWVTDATAGTYISAAHLTKAGNRYYAEKIATALAAALPA